MNPQQKFIDKLVGREEKHTHLSKEAQDIEMGIFRGGAKTVRQRSINSSDFEMQEPQKKVKATKKKPITKQYKRKPVARLRSVAI